MNKERLQAIINVTLIVLAIITLTVITTKDNTQDNNYYRSAEVTDIKGAMCYLEDTEGNVWCYESEQLKMYGRYTLVMSDNNTTEDITDDIILTIE